MRVLVTGSRTWSDPTHIHKALDSAYERMPIGDTLTVAHGACPSGADAHAEAWAIRAITEGKRVEVERHPADWETYGRRAGFKRNTEMAQTYPDVCLAFVRDGSRGTRHCIKACSDAGIPVIRLDWHN